MCDGRQKEEDKVRKNMGIGGCVGKKGEAQKKGGYRQKYLVK